MDIHRREESTDEVSDSEVVWLWLNRARGNSEITLVEDNETIESDKVSHFFKVICLGKTINS